MKLSEPLSICQRNRSEHLFPRELAASCGLVSQPATERDHTIAAGFETCRTERPVMSDIITRVSEYSFSSARVPSIKTAPSTNRISEHDKSQSKMGEHSREREGKDRQALYS